MRSPDHVSMEPMAQAREGMHVVDVAGQDVGRVELGHMGDPEASTTAGDQAVRGPLNLIAEALAPNEREPDVPEPLRSRLLLDGYMKVDGPDLLDTDRYVPANLVRAATDDRIHLIVGMEQLTKEQ